MKAVLTALGIAAVLALASPARSLAQERAALELFTAGQGSAFLPYGQGLAKHLGQGGAGRIGVRESKGSNENLDVVDARPEALGTAFLGAAAEAVAGTGWAAGKPHANVRALFPMYETSFQVAALASKGIRSVRDLDGKRVGVGPAGGPAEIRFRAVAEDAGIRPIIVGGEPAELARETISGELDALWQGAVVPIPSLTEFANGAEAVVFGLTEAEIQASLRRFPFLSETTIPAGRYKGQTEPIRSISAWNFVIAHKDLPEAEAYAITKAALSAADPGASIHPFVAGTTAADAAKNLVLPFHPGAARFYAERGVPLPTR